MGSGRHPTGLWGFFAQASQAVIMVSSGRTQALALRGFCLLLRPECPQLFPSLPGEPHQHPKPSHTGVLEIAFVSKDSRGTVITPHNFLILPSVDINILCNVCTFIPLFLAAKSQTSCWGHLEPWRATVPALAVRNESCPSSPSSELAGEVVMAAAVKREQARTEGRIGNLEGVPV